jgi:hypothetical protein
MHNSKPLDWYSLYQQAPAIMDTFEMFLKDFYPNFSTKNPCDGVEKMFFVYAAGVIAAHTFHMGGVDKSIIDTQIEAVMDIVDDTLPDDKSTADESKAVNMATKIINKTEHLPDDLTIVAASIGGVNPNEFACTPKVCTEELNAAIARAKQKGMSHLQIEDKLTGFNEFFIDRKDTRESIAKKFDKFFGI